MPALWVFKCNINDENHEGDWNYFFETLRGRGIWGGTEHTNHAGSQKLLREEILEGDFMLAWQTDQQAALGLCRVKKLRHKGEHIQIVLETVQKFDPPIELLPLKEESPALANGMAFKQGKLGTFFETTNDEAKEIMAICGIQKSLFQKKRRLRVAKTKR